MRRVILALCALAVLLCAAPRAEVTVYNIDLNSRQTVPGTGGLLPHLNCFVPRTALLSSLNLPADATCNLEP
jgi:hypothetical protein